MLPDNCSMVMGLVLVETDDPIGEDTLTLEHLTAYKGDLCSEALFGLLSDEELIDKGVVDLAFDHMKEALEAHGEEEGKTYEAHTGAGSAEGDSSSGVQDPG